MVGLPKPNVPSRGGRLSLALIIVIPTFILMALILFWPGSQVTTRYQNGTQVTILVPLFSDRVDALKTVLTVVGVWIGAIVAFFFSSENLEKANEATQKTIELLSPIERLRKKTAKDNMLTPPYFKTPHDTIGVFKDFLTNNPSGYPFEYLLIADDQVRPLGVLNDHEVEDYVIENLTAGRKKDEIWKDELLEVIKVNKDWTSDNKTPPTHVRDNFVKVHPDTPLSVVKDMMLQRKVRLAYVTDRVKDADIVLGVISMRTILDAVIS